MRCVSIQIHDSRQPFHFAGTCGFRTVGQIIITCQHQVRTAQTEDHKEGVASFLEKREPVFRGR